jgi:hypothetical protein
MNPKLGRKFKTREDFTGGFVRRLSDRGIELDVPGDVAPPTGTPLDLDLRLEDGSHLIVGTGEVTEGGKAGSAFRVRFLELSEETRAGLEELIVHVAAREDVPPRGDRQPAGSIVDLVQETYGERGTPSAVESSSIMVPPDPETIRSATARQPSREAPPASVQAPRPASGRPSLLRRLGISPGVIVVAVIAGVTGAAADAWFEDLASFVGELTDGSEDVTAATVSNIPPANVTPSDFSAETAAGAPEEGSRGLGDGDLGDDASAGAAEDATGGAPTDDLVDESAGSIEPLPTSRPTAGRPADRVRLISWDEGPSETVVTFWGNGTFPTDRVVRVRVAGGQPRELIKLRGIDLPYRETAVLPGTAELERIRTGFHPREPINELHVVLDLAGPQVSLDRVEYDENTLRFHLRTAEPEPVEEAAVEG